MWKNTSALEDDFIYSLNYLLTLNVSVFKYDKYDKYIHKIDRYICYDFLKEIRYVFKMNLLTLITPDEFETERHKEK